jgi:hypothetical protein
VRASFPRPAAAEVFRYAFCGVSFEDYKESLQKRAVLEPKTGEKSQMHFCYFSRVKGLIFGALHPKSKLQCVCMSKKLRNSLSDASWSSRAMFFTIRSPVAQNSNFH